MPPPPSHRRTDHTSRAMRVTAQTVVVSTALGLVKIVSGWIGHSYALIADGIESIMDIFGSLVVWSGLRIAARPPDRDHPYGHGKAESLAAMVVAVGLIGTGIALAVQSVREIVTPHRGPAPFTLVVLALVVVTKELLFRRLVRVGRETDATSVQVDAWHQRSDALTSGAAFVGISIAVIGGEKFATADDWAALFACAIILWNGARVLRISLAEVMDAAPSNDFDRQVRAHAQSVDGVVRVEKCLARKSGPGWLIDIHVEVDGSLPVSEGHGIGHRVKDALLDAGLGVIDVLVHIEPADTNPSQRTTRRPVPRGRPGVSS